LAAASLTGRIAAVIDANNKITAFGFTNATTVDATNKWAYFDGTTWEVEVGTTPSGLATDNLG
jgi:hypothetical protein